MRAFSTLSPPFKTTLSFQQFALHEPHRQPSLLRRSLNNTWSRLGLGLGLGLGLVSTKELIVFVDVTPSSTPSFFCYIYYRFFSRFFIYSLTLINNNHDEYKFQGRALLYEKWSNTPYTPTSVSRISASIPSGDTPTSPIGDAH